MIARGRTPRRWRRRPYMLYSLLSVYAFCGGVFSFLVETMNLEIVGPLVPCGPEGPPRRGRHAAQPNGGQGRVDVCGALPAVGTSCAWRWHCCGLRRNRLNQASAARLLPAHEAGCYRDGVEPQSGLVCGRKLHAVSRPARMLKDALMTTALRPALRPALGSHGRCRCYVWWQLRAIPRGHGWQ